MLQIFCVRTFLMVNLIMSNEERLIASLHYITSLLYVIAACIMHGERLHSHYIIHSIIT